MKTQRIMAAHFLDPIEVGDTFLKWPHHVTLIPWFICNDTSKFIKDVWELSRKYTGIAYEVGAVAHFGYNHNVPVSLIKSNKDLTALHMDLLKSAKSFDQYMEDRFCGKSYTPHITHKNKYHPVEGDWREVREIFVIEEVDNDTDYRRIIGVIPRQT